MYCSILKVDILLFIYSRITLVVPNYEAAPRLFYSEYFWQRYITCDSAAHQELPMGKIFPEILNLCESRKFCDDPASRSANWDQVNKIFSQFQRNLSISKISLKLREYFVYLVPVCGPGSWVIAKFSHFTQIEDFSKSLTHGDYLEKF